MRDEVNIRFIRKEDIPEIVSLVRISFNELYLTASIYSCFGIEKFIADELENKYSPYKYFVAELDGKIAGFAEYKIFPETSCAFLNMIATDQNFKGKGIGNRIFAYAKEFFKNLRLTNIQLDVFASNTIAKKWYYALGFKDENSKSFYQYSGNETLYNDDNDSVIVNNYVSFKNQYVNFGFSFLETEINNINVNLGVINNNGILRQSFSEPNFYSKIFNLISKYDLKNLYYIGENITNTGFNKIDEIIRLKINI